MPEPLSGPPHLRPATDADLEAVTAFLSALDPERPQLPDSLRRLDAERQATHHHRTLAWSGDRLQGVAETERGRQFTQPGWYGLHVHTARPELVTPLTGAAEAALRPHAPQVVWTRLDEHDPLHPVRLAQGWREHERMFVSVLDLKTFNVECFRHHAAQLGDIQISPLNEAGWSGSEADDRRLYALTIELLADVPGGQPITPWPFETWRERVIGQPDFAPDGPLIAHQGGVWVGLSECYLPRPGVPGQLHQGLTGVRRAWRGRGVAWALKLAGAERAQARGSTSIRTGNHSGNVPMLGINTAMGFVRGSARVVLRRDGLA